MLHARIKDSGQGALAKEIVWVYGHQSGIMILDGDPTVSKEQGALEPCCFWRTSAMQGFQDLIVVPYAVRYNTVSITDRYWQGNI